MAPTYDGSTSSPSIRNVWRRGRCRRRGSFSTSLPHPQRIPPAECYTTTTENSFKCVQIGVQLPKPRMRDKHRCRRKLQQPHLSKGRTVYTLQHASQAPQQYNLRAVNRQLHMAARRGRSEVQSHILLAHASSYCRGPHLLRKPSHNL